MTSDEAKSKDPAAWAAAVEVDALNKRGQRIVIDAALRATDQMPKLLHNLTTKEAKIEALRHHGLHLGIGSGFMDKIAPQASTMPAELRARGASETESQILAQLWLAKIFIEIGKGIANENK